MKKFWIVAAIVGAIVGSVFWYKSGTSILGISINPNIKKIYLHDPESPLLIYENKADRIRFSLSVSNMQKRLKNNIDIQKNSEYRSQDTADYINEHQDIYDWIARQSKISNEIDLSNYHPKNNYKLDGNDMFNDNLVEEEIKTGNAIVFDEDGGQKVKYIKYYDNDPHMALWSYDKYFELPSGRVFFYFAIIS